MAQQRQFDYLFKIVIVGDSGVGKTNLLSKYAHNSFQQSTRTTIGVQLLMHTLQIEGKWIQSQIWDTAGQERFRAITSSYYRNAVGVIIVFDLTKTQSFQHLENWLKQVKSHSQPQISILIVGNKSDLSNREIKQELIEDFINRNNLSYIEASAKDGVNVQQTFKLLMQQVYHQQKNKDHGRRISDKTFTKQLTNTNKQPTKNNSNKEKQISGKEKLLLIRSYFIILFEFIQMSSPASSSQEYFQDIFGKIQEILENKKQLSQEDLNNISELINNLNEQYGESTIPTSLIVSGNAQSINQHIKSEMDKLGARYKRNKLSHQILHQSQLTMVVKQSRTHGGMFSVSPSSSI